ncbi:palmitoyltransferase swf1 [Lecanora helva]
MSSDAVDVFAGFENRDIWGKDKTWSQFFSIWGWTFSEDVRIGAVGMLALLTAPLAWGLLAYHIYLIWAGMTTNESSKWADWRDDIADGLVSKTVLTPEISASIKRDTDVEPFVDWPISSNQQIRSARNDRSQDSQIVWSIDHNANLGVNSTHNYWKPVQSLEELDNIYDLGFEDNLKNILPS